jgi:hypothetical protein
MEIFYNHCQAADVQHLKIQTIYMQAWIASCMGWEFVCLEDSEEGSKATYKNKGKQIAVYLRTGKEEGIIPGAILSLRFQCPEEYLIELEREKESARIRLKISDMVTCEIPQTFSLNPLEKGISFVKEIFYSDSSSHYRKMLKLLSHQNWRV